MCGRTVYRGHLASLGGVAYIDGDAVGALLDALPRVGDARGDGLVYINVRDGWFAALALNNETPVFTVRDGPQGAVA